eukprot:TRINITY_DN6221_c0_g2_i2.p1 TRINITY_DN6221_c0_g2~~TRINITY_DN6221_c0_g2_i2.p1  ORF type:complete len:287 (-),score=48.54 TRINITY_DN6221_c0_g2_i2:38-898(-)
MVESSGDGFFDVILTRGQGTASKLGVSVADDGQPNLLVTGVDEEGLIASWNASMSLWQEQVHVGDRFCEVNGVGGDGALMLQVLVEQQELRIRAKKALPSVAGDFEVRLDKSSGADLGLQVDLADQTSIKDGKQVTQGHLSVIAIDPGIASQYNTTCPLDRRIVVGDQIVDVNGESTSSELMLHATKHKHVVVLNIKRTVSEVHHTQDKEEVHGEGTDRGKENQEGCEETGEQDVMAMATDTVFTGVELAIDIKEGKKGFTPVIAHEDIAESKRAVSTQCCLIGLR